MHWFNWIFDSLSQMDLVIQLIHWLDTPFSIFTKCLLKVLKWNYALKKGHKFKGINISHWNSVTDVHLAQSEKTELEV